MLNKKFKIYTLGCKINQYDSASLKNFLINSGFKYQENKPNFIIINSCSVTKIAIHKAKKIVNFVKRNNANAKIILIGCWPRVYQSLNYNQVDLIWSGKSENWKSLLKEIEKNFFPKESSVSCSEKNKNLNLIGERHRYFIKIQDGCEQFCSYCVIPFSRGPLKSKKVKDVLAEIEKAILVGYQEIVLSGIHLGLYGRDFEGQKIDLFYLLKKIIKIKNLGRIRLSSIEVNELNDDILDLVVNSNNKICPHFHIPLQAGSDKVLKLMNRPYNLSYFSERINKIRETIPLVSISTDLIVGFPGENDKDFSDSYNFCKKISFDKIHVFSFSAHEKARAFSFPNRNSEEVIKKRSKKMRELSQKTEDNWFKNILKNGHFIDVLVEDNDGTNVKGKSQYYFDYSFKLKEFSIENKKIIPGKIFRLDLRKKI